MQRDRHNHCLWAQEGPCRTRHQWGDNPRNLGAISALERKDQFAPAACRGKSRPAPRPWPFVHKAIVAIEALSTGGFPDKLDPTSVADGALDKPCLPPAGRAEPKVCLCGLAAEGALRRIDGRNHALQSCRQRRKNICHENPTNPY